MHDALALNQIGTDLRDYPPYHVFLGADHFLVQEDELAGWADHPVPVLEDEVARREDRVQGAGVSRNA